MHPHKIYFQLNTTTHLNSGHILGETFVLLGDLESELAGVAHDQHADAVVARGVRGLQL